MKKAKIERFLVDLEKLHEKKITEKQFLFFGSELENLVNEYFKKTEFSYLEKQTYFKNDLDLFINTPINYVKADYDNGEKYNFGIFRKMYVTYIERILRTNQIIFNNDLAKAFLYACDMRREYPKTLRYRILTNMFYGLLTSKNRRFVDFIYDHINIGETLSEMYLSDIKKICDVGDVVYVGTDDVMFRGEINKKLLPISFDLCCESVELYDENIIKEIGITRYEKRIKGTKYKKHEDLKTILTKNTKK